LGGPDPPVRAPGSIIADLRGLGRQNKEELRGFAELVRPHLPRRPTPHHADRLAADLAADRDAGPARPEATTRRGEAALPVCRREAMMLADGEGFVIDTPEEPAAVRTADDRVRVACARTRRAWDIERLR